MSASGQRLGLRLFLEGIEVPVVSAQVQININSPATATIQVVPGDKLLEFKARTMVHLFFWDYTLDNQSAPQSPDPQRVADDNGISIEEAKQFIANNPETFAMDVDAELRGYKLLYSGEVIGVVMAKTPTGRQAVLQCSDFSTYWDTTYQFFISYSPNGNFLGTSAAIWAGSDSMFDDLTAGHVSVMNEYLRSRPQTEGLKNVKGLMGGIISLLEAMGGVPNHTHGINDFFTIAEVKNHILQQIVCEQDDDTAEQLFDDKAFMDWLTRGMSSLGQLVTFRDMMKLLFQYVYYEVVPNPAPMYLKAIPASARDKKTNFTSKVELPAQLRGKLQETALVAEQWQATGWDDVANANEMVGAKSFKADFAKILNSPDMPKSYKTKLEQVNTFLDKIRSTVNDNRKAAPSKTFDDNRKFWQRVTSTIFSVLNTDIVFSGTKTQTIKKSAELDQLHTQIFRPDCFFAAAPRCNVIFPDQYTQFQYSRNFLQETTRLRLHEEWEFGINEGLLETNVHFAPSTTEIEKLAKQQQNSGVRALLPWEIYSGILPKFETIHEVNYVAGRAERKRGIKGNIKGAAVDYAQRTANFNYMKYRFASRTCEVSLKFNPFLVCGFPAVIIERPFIMDPSDAWNIRQQAIAAGAGNDLKDFVRFAADKAKAPRQYIGMVAAVSHSIQQDGASTSIVLTHARTHRITDDDFLGVFSTQTNNQVQKEIVSTVLDAEELLRKGDWRLLKYLQDATPQNLDQQAQVQQDKQNNLLDDNNSPPIESRPTGAPSVASISSIGNFGSLLTPIPPIKTSRVTVPATENGTGRYPITGNTTKARSIVDNKTILVADPGGKLAIGSKGPQGGIIKQIQVLSNNAVAIVGQKTSKSLKSGQSVIIGPDMVNEFDKDPVTGKFTLRGNVIKSSNLTYYWKKIVIYEEKKTNKSVTTTLPIEESLRPPWFSPLYSNWFIGSEIYQNFFGCGSIVDQALFLSPEGTASFGTSSQKQQEMLDKLKAANNDTRQIAKIVSEAMADNITSVPDIESSVDVLAYIYGEIRRLGLDVHRFVNDYTHRPIATMEDMFGSSDLTYTINADKTASIEKGQAGFHSSAIASNLSEAGQLIGLLDNPDLKLPRLRVGSGKKVPVSRTLDPRPGRRAKVLEYLNEINAATGTLGVGVAG
jgi:hypothetical protein